jgi:hypothetical protein
MRHCAVTKRMGRCGKRKAMGSTNRPHRACITNLCVCMCVCVCHIYLCVHGMNKHICVLYGKKWQQVIIPART